ncbi:MAG: ATP-binding protein [Alphaproteobacteria bacterium]|nr:ATP-binding protein [Alphaproteobacteria bacterium]
MYSSIPAVLSEVVANAWDADSKNVRIDFDYSNNIIEITDDGHGMSEQDLNFKFLHIGYQKRENGESVTAKKNRPVMGRKGIGKLSLFSIADTIEVHSVKDGVKNGLRMKLLEIKDAISNGDETVNQQYHPAEVSQSEININVGTKIIISDLRKNINRSENFLKTRLARRFTVIGPKYDFIVKINDVEITKSDRNYFPKIQYLWLLGDDNDNYVEQSENAEEVSKIENIITLDKKKYKVSGWIGTLRSVGDAKDPGGESLNNISIMVRGKAAQEDILNEFGDAGIYAQYIVGEIHADFLDDDLQEDIATTSRQKLIEDDPRYQALREYLKNVLGKIRASWSDFRNEKGEVEARKNPKINAWMESLDVDSRKIAKRIFGKIHQMGLKESHQNELFAQSVIVIEGFKYKKKLSILNDFEEITSENIEMFSTVFSEIDEIEAAHYYQITKGRMDIIYKLQKMVCNNELEKTLQNYLFEHLWLLDPTWDRTTDTPVMEQTVKKEFENLNVNLSQEEKDGRIDIKYKTSAGMNIIIELKRPNVRKTCFQLLGQIDKYKTALRKCLDAAHKNNEPITLVCLVGSMPSDYNDENVKMLEAKGVRIKTYNALLEQTYQAYQKYLEQNRKSGQLIEFIHSLVEGS